MWVWVPGSATKARARTAERLQREEREVTEDGSSRSGTAGEGEIANREDEKVARVRWPTTTV